MNIEKLGPIVLAQRVTDLKFDHKGTKKLSLEYKAHKGKVFVFALIAIKAPEDINTKMISDSLKFLADQKWHIT